MKKQFLKHLETVNPGKSTGLDNLPAKFIRDGSSLDPHYKFIPSILVKSQMS